MRILIAEDSQTFRNFLKNNLSSWGFEPLLAQDGFEAWEILKGDDPPRIAILDWVMPRLSGPEVCRKVRNEKKRYIYLILLTSLDNRENLIEGMEAGADDYLTKPIHPQELLVRLKVGKRIIDLEDSLFSAKERLHFQATHDYLTGLPNRFFILQILNEEMERAKRDGYPLSVGVIDIDHFKEINDNLGHLTGDEVLKEVAKRIRSSLRVYDQIGRWGGEEFLIVIPLKEGNAESIGERLRKVVGEHPVIGENFSIHLTISLGIAVVPPENNVSLERVLKEADNLLYRAKKKGRNRVEVGAME